MIQQSPTEERARSIEEQVARAIAEAAHAAPYWEEYLPEARAAIDTLASQAAQPAEADGVERDQRFMSEVWETLKSDSTDLRKQQRILAAFRASIAATPKAPTSTAGEALRIAEQLDALSSSHRPLLDAASKTLRALATPPAPNDDLRAALEKALTPSAETKAAYIGEFSFSITMQTEDGVEYQQGVVVPWDTIKKIMAAIRAHAAALKENRRG